MKYLGEFCRRKPAFENFMKLRMPEVAAKLKLEYYRQFDGQAFAPDVAKVVAGPAVNLTLPSSDSSLVCPVRDIVIFNASQGSRKDVASDKDVKERILFERGRAAEQVLGNDRWLTGTMIVYAARVIGKKGGIITISHERKVKVGA